MLLVRHVARLIGHLLAFSTQGGARSVVLLVMVGGPLVALLGVIKLVGVAALYPFL